VKRRKPAAGRPDSVIVLVQPIRDCPAAPYGPVYSSRCYERLPPGGLRLVGLVIGPLDLCNEPARLATFPDGAQRVLSWLERQAQKRPTAQWVGAPCQA
jgi:hypothetical protein